MYHPSYRSCRSPQPGSGLSSATVQPFNVEEGPEAPPRACGEWIRLFQRFGVGDDATLAEMRRGTLELTRPERQRWQSALVDALELRLACLSMQLGERLNVAIRVGDVSAILGWLRAQLQPLYCLSRVPAFPRTVRERIDRSCRRWLQRSQARLEHEAAGTSDQELWLLTVRRSPLRWPPTTGTC